MTFLDPARVASAHHQAGISYSELRGKLRRLRLIEGLQGGDPSDLAAALESLATKKREVMGASPHIGGLAYRLGKASVSRGEHINTTDQNAAKA